jgi:hypothetical protein
MNRWVPLIQAARGIWDNEIQSWEKPAHLNLEDAGSLNEYLESFYVRSYRHEWAGIDEVTAPPQTPEPASNTSAPMPAYQFGSLGDGFDIQIFADCGYYIPECFIGELISFIDIRSFHLVCDGSKSLSFPPPHLFLASRSD